VLRHLTVSRDSAVTTPSPMLKANDKEERRAAPQGAAASA
jgi:ribosomal protein S6